MEKPFEKTPPRRGLGTGGEAPRDRRASARREDESRLALLLRLCRERERVSSTALAAVDLARAITRAAAGGAEEVFGRRVPGLSSLPPELAGDVYSALLDHGGRRHDLGAYYTPRALARRLVRLALASRPAAPVIDPACGAGAFLLEAARQLERKLGDRTAAARMLYGVDRDPGALKVCRAILACHGFEPPEENLVRADALEAPWPGEAAGFGAVVGNPPYRNIVRLSERTRRKLKERYLTFRNKCDIYGLFLEAAASRLVPGGRLALLVSDSFLGTSSFAPLRKLLFGAEMRTRLVESIAGAPFPGAAVKVVAIVSERRGRSKSAPRSAAVAGEAAPAFHEREIVRFTVISSTGRRRSCARVDAERMRRDCARSAAVPADPALLRLAETMRTAGVSLCELAVVALGVKTADDERFVSRAGERPGPAHVPCLRGRNVTAYRIDWAGDWLDYQPEVLRGVHGARPRQREHFDRAEKLLLRETSGTRLIAAFDDRRRFPLDTLHSIYPLDGKRVSLWYLLAVLNSKPASFWYGLHHPGPHVKAAEVRALPIPEPLRCRPAAMKAARAGALAWIAEASSVCSRTMSISDDGSRNGHADMIELPPIPASCLDPEAGAGMIETLAREAARDPDEPRALAARALLDELLWAAYAVEPHLRPPARITAHRRGESA